MNRFILYGSLIFTLLCTRFMQGVAQDIFSISASNKYAEFLMQKKAYSKAVTEYERLLFLDSTRHTFYKQQLAYCYFGLERTQAILATFNNQPDSLASQLVFLSYLRGSNFDTANFVLGKSNYQFSEETNGFDEGVLKFYNKNFAASARLLNQPYDNPIFETKSKLLYQLINETEAFKTKSPALAVGLSTIIPGLGRVYTKDYADAAFNFVLIGLTAFQAYRGFTEENIGQWQGWLYGGVSLSFYLGNLIGSHRAARKYNQTFYNQQFERADYYIFSDL